MRVVNSYNYYIAYVINTFKKQNYEKLDMERRATVNTTVSGKIIRKDNEFLQSWEYNNKT